MKLNLGACDRQFPGFSSVDLVPPADFVCDLREVWPFADDSIEAVKAFDIFEHLPDKIFTMNELYRVLVPGGLAEIEVPTFPGVGAVCDPTHVSYWSAGDFEYYEKGNFARERFRKYYEITADFRIVGNPKFSEYKNRFGESVTKVLVILEALK